jgi:putative endonuclease
VRGGWVYIVASRYRGTMYTGVSADLTRRVWQHKTGRGSRFARTYGVDRLVWAERHDDIADAIVREKRIKDWKRAWKIDLIEAGNPDWLDLYDTLHLA